MPKVTRQPSGVTAGTMDDSRQTQTTPSAAGTAAAGAALASRRHAGARAAKLAARQAGAPRSGAKVPAKRKPH